MSVVADVAKQLLMEGGEAAATNIARGAATGKSSVFPAMKARHVAIGAGGAAVGAYRGNKGAGKEYDKMSPDMKKRYVHAYGSNAKSAFQKKQTLKGGVAGFLQAGLGSAGGEEIYHGVKAQGGVRKTVSNMIHRKTSGSITGPTSNTMASKAKKYGKIVGDIGANAGAQVGLMYGASNAYGATLKKSKSSHQKQIKGDPNQ